MLEVTNFLDEVDFLICFIKVKKSIKVFIIANNYLLSFFLSVLQTIHPQSILINEKFFA